MNIELCSQDVLVHRYKFLRYLFVCIRVRVCNHNTSEYVSGCVSEFVYVNVRMLSILNLLMDVRHRGQHTIV